MRERFASDAANEPGGGVTLTLCVDVCPQPLVKRLELAAISVCRPAMTSGQPSRCGSVAAANRPENHLAIIG